MSSMQTPEMPGTPSGDMTVPRTLAPRGTRWDRLAADLATADIPVRVDEHPYTEIVRGRPRSGTSRSIWIRHPAGGAVIIRDVWWDKNPDRWVGWEAYREDADGIIRSRPSRWSKNRGEVVAAVTRMLEASDGQ